MILNINIDVTTWALVFILSNVSAEESRTGIFCIEPDTLNARLDGLVFGTFEKIPPRLCFNKCIRRPKCHSYNYNRAMLKCELNVKPMSEADFHNKDGYVYVEIDRYRGDSLYDTCRGNHCKEGEVCESLKNGKKVCVQDRSNLQNLDISVGKTQYDMIVCAHYDGPGTNGEHIVFNMERKAIGRYVKLNIVGIGRLQFAEIKVFAVPTESVVC
ncbi:unnamed protein product [Mytilus coruscus]|uniref:Apple domain-containing protein n=1 Tax=Mytilus coruscus TaxID=42192 RepID=A0A6J8CVE4_MYTCO|nr:unnamed protein product [Mytilus coruscus]